MAETITNSPILFALATGLLPTLFWLYFWLRIDRDRPEPFGLLFLCFIVGAASVFFATTLQKTVGGFFASDTTTRVAVFAGIEEVLKLLVFAFIAAKSDYNDEPLDPAIYLITVALGFAALENIFYVMQPSVHSSVTAGLLTGGFRFFGSTLLHTIASSFVGIFIALSPRGFRGLGAILGLGGAIFLHTAFNFFILKNDTASFLQIYGYLWVAAIISLLILEKLRRLPPQSTALKPV